LITALFTFTTSGCKNDPLDNSPSNIAYLIKHGDTEELKKLIGEEPDIINKRYDYEFWKNNTLLHIAADKGAKEMVELLISGGADIKIKDSSGTTPLHFAVCRQNKDVAELLITSGSDVNTKDNNGNTPLYVTAKYGYKNMAELLISSGADVNMKNNEGETPLNLAIENGQNELAELLRKYGAKE